MQQISSDAAPPAQPRDAKWVSALPLVVGGLAILAGLKMLGVLPGNGGNLAAGTYGCFTTTLTPSPRQPRTQRELAEQTGQTMVRDVIPPNIMLFPAVFGSIIVDGDGGYTLSNSPESGEYRASGTDLSFTGGLDGLTVRSFDPDANRFSLAYQDMTIECSLNR
jgi:hypothetical protein